MSTVLMDFLLGFSIVTIMLVIVKMMFDFAQELFWGDK